MIRERFSNWWMNGSWKNQIRNSQSMIHQFNLLNDSVCTSCQRYLISGGRLCMLRLTHGRNLRRSIERSTNLDHSFWTSRKSRRIMLSSWWKIVLQCPAYWIQCLHLFLRFLLTYSLLFCFNHQPVSSNYIFSTTLKLANVSLLLKKSSHCPDELSNYRPVSYLSFVLKLIERVIFLFATTSQFYMPFPISTDGREQSIVSETTSDCIAEMKQWTYRNKMKFNVGKTDTILVYSGSSRIKPNDISIEVGEENIKPSSSVRNLGITLDSNLNLGNHIKIICKRAQFHIQKISWIRRYLDQESTTRLMSAFVLSLLENGNSILFGLPDKLLKWLQSIQHAAARVVSGRRKFDHISDVLRSLHWLPIRLRIEFKIVPLVFRCVSGDAPSYLRELVKPYQPNRNLRFSDNSLDLVVQCRSSHRATRS